MEISLIMLEFYFVFDGEKKPIWYTNFFYTDKTQQLALPQEEIPVQSVQGKGQAADESFGVARKNELGVTGVQFSGGDQIFQTRIGMPCSLFSPQLRPTPHIRGTPENVVGMQKYSHMVSSDIMRHMFLKITESWKVAQ